MLTFNEETHTYTDDGKVLVSVTQLLQKHHLVDDLSFIDEDVLKKAADYGTMVHKEIEDFIKTGEKGISWEVEEFIKVSNDFKPLLAETKVYNDVVAGTIDLIADFDGCYILGDHKTTSVLHKDALSWQLSIYHYLYCKGKQEEKPKMEFYGLFGFWYDKKNEKLEVVKINPKPIQEIEKLLECERKGLIYEAPKTVFNLTVEEIKRLKAEIEEKQQRVDELTEAIKNEMESYGYYSLSNETASVAYIGATKTATFDKAKFEKEHPELKDKYVKYSNKKSSVRLTFKEVNNE